MSRKRKPRIAVYVGEITQRIMYTMYGNSVFQEQKPMTPLSREKCIFRGALLTNDLLNIYCDEEKTR